jgi:hypothetical protein
VKSDLSALHGIQQPAQKKNQKQRRTPEDAMQISQNNQSDTPGPIMYTIFRPVGKESSCAFSDQCRCQQLCSVPRILSAAVDKAIIGLAAHITLHVSDVVELCDVAVFLHVGAFVFGHRGDEIFDDFVGDKGMAEVHFCDVWLHRN